MKCLLVDDDSDDRSIFSHILSKINSQIELETAVDGVDAIEKLRKGLNKPDLIFLDLNMPRMNGMQFLFEVKGDTDLRFIPVVIYSTSNSSLDIEKAEKLGACDYMIKPFDVFQLEKNISEALNKIDLYKHLTMKNCGSR